MAISGRLALTVICAICLVGCATSVGSVLDPAGPIAAQQRQLLIDAVSLMLIVVLPVFILMIIVIWRYRAARPLGKYTPDWGSAPWLEAAFWLVPLAIVIALAVLVWQRTHQLDPYRPLVATEAPLQVEVVALDWQWLFIYPEQNIASLNRLVFPADRPLQLVLTSDSVMNAFWIPALGSQIYAMAGMRTQLNLMADAPGQFPGRNTQFNGVGFSDQHFMAEAVSADAFTAFVDSARSAGLALDSAAYAQLRIPAATAPPQQYAPVAPHLFDTIIAAYEGHPAHAH